MEGYEGGKIKIYEALEGGVVMTLVGLEFEKIFRCAVRVRGRTALRPGGWPTRGPLDAMPSKPS